MAYDPNLGYDPDNIAASINDAAARGDDAEVERLSIARWNKLQSNPDLMTKYGNDAYSQVARNALRKQGAATAPADTATAGAAQGGAQQGQTFPEMMQWIDTLYSQQKAGALAGLDQSRQAALASLEGERAALIPQYTAQRQQIAATGDVEAQRLNEFLAAQGLARSGAAGTLQARSGATTTGQLAQARMSEAQALQDIMRRQTGVEQQYQAAAQQQAAASEAARIEALLNQRQADRQFGLQAAGYTGMLDGQQTLQGQRAAMEAEDYQRSLVEAARQREIDTIGQYANIEGGYMSEIQRRQNTQTTDDDWLIPYLTVARNEKIAAMNAGASAAAASQYEQAKDIFEMTGTASGWVAEALGLPEGATTREYLSTLYTVNRPYSTGSSGGGGGGGGSTPGAMTENQRFNSLMDIWKATGVAPEGMSDFGIAPGTPMAGAAAPKPVSFDDAWDEINLIANGKTSNGKVVMPAQGGKAAFARLTQLVDSGQVDEATADWIIANTPALRAYINSNPDATVAEGRARSQTRTDY
jgi:hypothetical protein